MRHKGKQPLRYSPFYSFSVINMQNANQDLELQSCPRETLKPSRRGLESLRGKISRARHPSPKHINEMPERLRRFFVGQRRRRIKKEFGIDVGDALAYDFADTIAVTPPLFRILIRVGDCYDTYRHVPADCLLIEKARSPRVAPSVKTLMLHTRVLCSRNQSRSAIAEL